MRHKIWLLLLMLTLLLGSAYPAHASCTTYPGSHVEDFDLPDGPACLGGGSGCTECVDYNPGTGGGSVCIWSTPWDLYCVYFGPENQNV